MGPYDILADFVPNDHACRGNLTSTGSYGRIRPYIKEGTTMCWEREESKKISEEVDEVLKKLVREAEKEQEAEVPAKAG